MTCTDLPLPAPTAARSDDSTLFAALELSRKSWLLATNAPGEEKVSKRTIAAGDGRALLDLLAGLREKAERRIGKPVKVVVIQEAGLDGFWLHRLLEALKAMSSIPPRSRWIAGSDGASPRCRRAATHADGVGTRRAPGVLDGRARRTSLGRRGPKLTDACRGNARRW